MKYNFITKFSKPHFPNIVIKMSWKCDMAEITWITFSSQFLHNVMKTEFCTFLKYNADILYNLLVNSGSHLYEKVMKLWCVKICTHFLAHFIWILPPCKKVDDHLRWWWRMTVCPGLLSYKWDTYTDRHTDRRTYYTYPKILISSHLDHNPCVYVRSKSSTVCSR